MDGGEAAPLSARQTKIDRIIFYSGDRREQRARHKVLYQYRWRGGDSQIYGIYITCLECDIYSGICDTFHGGTKNIFIYVFPSDNELMAVSEQSERQRKTMRMNCGCCDTSPAAAFFVAFLRYYFILFSLRFSLVSFIHHCGNATQFVTRSLPLSLSLPLSTHKFIHFHFCRTYLSTV